MATCAWLRRSPCSRSGGASSTGPFSTWSPFLRHSASSASPLGLFASTRKASQQVEHVHSLYSATGYTACKHFHPLDARKADLIFTETPTIVHCLKWTYSPLLPLAAHPVCPTDSPSPQPHHIDHYTGTHAAKLTQRSSTRPGKRRGK